MEPKKSLKNCSVNIHYTRIKPNCYYFMLASQLLFEILFFNSARDPLAYNGSALDS